VSRRELAIRVAGLLCFASLMPTLSSSLEGQADRPTEAPVLLAARSARGHVQVDSSTTTVGFALRIPGGSALDPVGREGTAGVLAAALNLVFSQQMGSLAASAEVRFDGGGFTVLGRATPDAIGPLVEAIERVLFVDPAPIVALEQARARQLGRLRFESGAPVRAFEDHVGTVVFRGIAGWGRPARGTLESVEAVDLRGLAAFPAFDASARAAASAAIVGPVDRSAAWAWIATLLGPVDDAPSPPPPGLAWSVSARQDIEAEITSTWVAVALPIRSDTPTWKIELLAHHIAEVLEPDHARPGLVSPSVRVLRPNGLPVVLVTFAISPERANTWVERILTTARLDTDAPPDERFFRWQRKRFRTEWLGNRARPEQRAERLALGWAGNTPDAMEAPFDIGVWRTDLEDAARALGQPRIVVFGPELGSSQNPDSGDSGAPAMLDSR